jgi:hypothetical protein
VDPLKLLGLMRVNRTWKRLIEEILQKRETIKLERETDQYVISIGVKKVSFKCYYLIGKMSCMNLLTIREVGKCIYSHTPMSDNINNIGGLGETNIITCNELRIYTTTHGWISLESWGTFKLCSLIINTFRSFMYVNDSMENKVIKQCYYGVKGRMEVLYAQLNTIRKHNIMTMQTSFEGIATNVKFYYMLLRDEIEKIHKEAKHFCRVFGGNFGGDLLEMMEKYTKEKNVRMSVIMREWILNRLKFTTHNLSWNPIDNKIYWSLTYNGDTTVGQFDDLKTIIFEFSEYMEEKINEMFVGHGLE